MASDASLNKLVELRVGQMGIWTATSNILVDFSVETLNFAVLFTSFDSREYVPGPHDPEVVFDRVRFKNCSHISVHNQRMLVKLSG